MLGRFLVVSKESIIITPQGGLGGSRAAAAGPGTRAAAAGEPRRASAGGSRGLRSVKLSAETAPGRQPGAAAGSDPGAAAGGCDP